MTADIVPELFEKIRKEFLGKIESDSLIKKNLEKIDTGKGGYEAAGAFAERVGQVLANAIKTNISEEILPDGKMYWNIADRVLRPLFEDDYRIVSEVAVKAQEILNKAAGIGIKAQKAEINKELIDGVLNKVASSPKYSEVERLLQDSIVTVSRVFADDTLKKNIEFQGRLGLTPKIIRRAEKKCCKWCRNLAGIYEYPIESDDVYKRHENCRCIVEYDPGKGKRQNVHTKKWTDPQELDKIEERKKIGLRTRFKTAKMSTEEYERAKRLWKKNKELPLSTKEKEHVYEEFDNNLTIEEKEGCIVQRPIGNYRYKAINLGHNQYKIIDKVPILESTGDVHIDQILDEVLDFNWRELL